jgi:hypothetical protein
MLAETLAQCTGKKELDAWFKLNARYIDTLGRAEQDKVKELYDAKESTLQGAPTPLTEGAFGG